MKNVCLGLLLMSTISANAFASGPCKEKVEARHAARKAVHDCLESWARDAKPTDADPSDNCTAKVENFVQAAKDVKSCRAQNKK